MKQQLPWRLIFVKFQAFIKQPAKSDNLYTGIKTIPQQTRQIAYRAANFTMVAAYKETGKHIAAYEQQGKNRAAMEHWWQRRCAKICSWFLKLYRLSYDTKILDAPNKHRSGFMHTFI